MANASGCSLGLHLLPLLCGCRDCGVRWGCGCVFLRPCVGSLKACVSKNMNAIERFNALDADTENSGTPHKYHNLCLPG